MFISPISVHITLTFFVSAQGIHAFFPSLQQPSSFSFQSLCVGSLLPETLCPSIFPQSHPSIIKVSVQMSPFQTSFLTTQLKASYKAPLHYSICSHPSSLSSESLTSSKIIYAYHLSPAPHQPHLLDYKPHESRGRVCSVCLLWSSANVV